MAEGQTRLSLVPSRAILSSVPGHPVQGMRKGCIGRCNFRSASGFFAVSTVKGKSSKKYVVSGALRLHITDCRQEDLGPLPYVM